MVPIVQSVRASDCGSECREFESHWAPSNVKSCIVNMQDFFVFMKACLVLYNIFKFSSGNPSSSSQSQGQFVKQI